MNAEKLRRLQSQVRIGGKGTPRRKKKVMHQSAATDDKKLQSSLKKLSVSTIPGIEEVNIIKDDLTVIHFNNPKAQASLSANTFAVTGHGESKKIVEMLPEILPQLGQETVMQLRMFANTMSGGSQEKSTTGPSSSALENVIEEDEVPLLVSDFEEVAKMEEAANNKDNQKVQPQPKLRQDIMKNKENVLNDTLKQNVAELKNSVEKNDKKTKKQQNKQSGNGAAKNKTDAPQTDHKPTTPTPQKNNEKSNKEDLSSAKISTDGENQTKGAQAKKEKRDLCGESPKEKVNDGDKVETLEKVVEVVKNEPQQMKPLIVPEHHDVLEKKAVEVVTTADLSAAKGIEDKNSKIDNHDREKENLTTIAAESQIKDEKSKGTPPPQQKKLDGQHKRAKGTSPQPTVSKPQQANKPNPNALNTQLAVKEKNHPPQQEAPITQLRDSEAEKKSIESLNQSKDIKPLQISKEIPSQQENLRPQQPSKEASPKERDLKPQQPSKEASPKERDLKPQQPSKEASPKERDLKPQQPSNKEASPKQKDSKAKQTVKGASPQPKDLKTKDTAKSSPHPPAALKTPEASLQPTDLKDQQASDTAASQSKGSKTPQQPLKVAVPQPKDISPIKASKDAEPLCSQQQNDLLLQEAHKEETPKQEAKQQPKVAQKENEKIQELPKNPLTLAKSEQQDIQKQSDIKIAKIDDLNQPITQAGPPPTVDSVSSKANELKDQHLMHPVKTQQQQQTPKEIVQTNIKFEEASIAPKDNKLEEKTENIQNILDNKMAPKALETGKEPPMHAQDALILKKSEKNVCQTNIVESAKASDKKDSHIKIQPAVAASMIEQATAQVDEIIAAAAKDAVKPLTAADVLSKSITSEKSSSELTQTAGETIKQCFTPTKQSNENVVASTHMDKKEDAGQKPESTSVPLENVVSTQMVKKDDSSQKSMSPSIPSEKPISTPQTPKKDEPGQKRTSTSTSKQPTPQPAQTKQTKQAPQKTTPAPATKNNASKPQDKQPNTAKPTNAQAKNSASPPKKINVTPSPPTVTPPTTPTEASSKPTPQTPTPPASTDTSAIKPKDTKPDNLKKQTAAVQKPNQPKPKPPNSSSKPSPTPTAPAGNKKASPPTQNTNNNKQGKQSTTPPKSSDNNSGGKPKQASSPNAETKVPDLDKTQQPSSSQTAPPVQSTQKSVP